jgi:hypothetical protein
MIENIVLGIVLILLVLALVTIAFDSLWLGEFLIRVLRLRTPARRAQLDAQSRAQSDAHLCAQPDAQPRTPARTHLCAHCAHPAHTGLCGHTETAAFDTPLDTGTSRCPCTTPLERTA